ncbi:MAG: SDR family oxidoreductase [Cyanobacteria bacterium J06638_22]
MQDKVVVVVGATGGIGTALCQQLAPTGAKMVLAARNRDRLSTLEQQLATAGASEVLTVSTDITDPTQANALMEKTMVHFGAVDVLVNTAGAGILKQYNKLSAADFDAMLDLNLKGSFYTAQAAANVMREQRSGHICNLAGILGKHSMVMGTAYCASKFGVVGFTKCMAEELKRFGIKFTLFYFGGVDSPFWDAAGLKVDRSKMLRPTTAANAIVFAISQEPAAIPMEVNIQPDSHLFF